MTAVKVRAAARALRLRLESGDLLTMEEARAACVTRDDALLAFERIEDIEREFWSSAALAEIKADRRKTGGR